MAGTPGPKRSLNDADLYHATDDSLVWKGTRVHNGPGDALWLGAPTIADNNLKRFFLFEDDFLTQGSATTPAGTTYTDMKATGGTNAFQNVAGGVFNLVTSTTNDDYRGLRTTAQNWKFAAAKELWFEAAFTVNEGQANLSSWQVGLMDTFTTGGIQAGTAGPLGSFSGAVIFKTQGGMAAKLMTSNGATQNTSAAIATVVTNQKIRAGFYFDGAITTSNVTPYVDIGDGNGFVAGASQTITLAALNAMSLVATIKCGASGTIAETMQLDYLYCLALR